MKAVLDACVLYPTIMREILFKVASRGRNLGEVDWCGEFICGDFANFFKETYSESRVNIHKHGGGIVRVDDIIVGHGGFHAVSVDSLKRVWDPPTNTWGQFWDDYALRFGYGSIEDFNKHFTVNTQ